MDQDSSKTGLSDSGLDVFKALAMPFDKDALKHVSIGARQFTSICPYTILQRMTETFGLCGVGWGWEITSLTETSVAWQDKQGTARHTHAIACRGRVWYMLEGVRYETPESVGDGAVLAGNIPEAEKKSITNMFSKCVSFLGIGLTIYQGKGMDDPYADREAEQPPPPPVLEMVPPDGAPPQQPLAPVVEQVQQEFGGRKPVCPNCGTNTAVIASKPEYGGGWVCYKNKSGCGHKWQ